MRRNLSIRFDFDSISIRYNLWFDSIENHLSSTEKNYFNREIRQSSRGNLPGCQKQLARSFVVTSCEFFTFYCQGNLIFCFQNLIKIESNRIVSKIGKKIWFNLHTIWFNLTKNIWFHKQIRFDLDLIWQPWSIASFHSRRLTPISCQLFTLLQETRRI
jgi:hypothetical protein